MTFRIAMRTPLLGLALLVALSATARADLSFLVTLDTTSLQSKGPFEIDFTLTNGGSPNVDQVMISNISLGTDGSAGSPIVLKGGASGDLNSGVTLTDPVLLNDFTQTFTPGSKLMFTVNLTTAANTPTPDNFSFSILDNTGTPLRTSDPSGADTLLNLDITGPSPTINMYGSTTAGLSAPTVTLINGVPEPASLVLLGLAAATAYTRGRRRPR